MLSPFFRCVRSSALAVLLSIIAMHASPAHAAGEFTSALTSSYSVTEKGTTHVVLDFSLTNNFSTMYATEYALEIGSNRVENVIATSNGATLPVTLTPYTNKTGVHFIFPDKVVGKDQTRTFSVAYDTYDIAQVNGSVLELNIPKLANPSEFSSYSVVVDVPERYGIPAVMQPPTGQHTIDNGRSKVSFTHTGLGTGISLLFGQSQTAKLGLTYHLENPKNAQATMEIALPADGTYQRVYYTAITPKPINIRIDDDGNWLALYELNPNQKLDVTVEGLAVISLQPTKLPTQKPNTATYLANQPFWQVNDPTITKLANELKTPQAIYEYVTKTLTYDYNRLEGENSRFGATGALNSPTAAVCLEFSDLFITLARAAGIPAREINGYAYTQNDKLRPLSLARDILHAWPEYWDMEAGHWVGVDPTWGNTTGGVDYFNRLDFNRVAFVTHGRSSELPYAAGMYKYADQETKDVTVEFVADQPTESLSVDASIAINPKAVLGMPDSYSLRIQNNALHAVYDVPYTITYVDQNTPQQSGTVSLPPLGFTRIPVELPRTQIFTATKRAVDITVGEQTFHDSINIQSFLKSNAGSVLIAVVVGGSVFIIAFITWRLLVPQRKR